MARRLLSRTDMLRTFSVFAFALTSILAAAGCSGRSDGPAPVSGASGALAGGTDSGLRDGDLSTGDGDTTADAATCATIVPADYDQSCHTDSDCVAVVLGGDVCNPCNAPEDFVCPAATVNAGASAAYNAALTAALGTAPSIHFSVDVCGIGSSCPVGSPACVSGQCTMVAPPGL
jgi:hypothetical protein